MRELSLDFETRSVCNLITEGAYRYAQHPSTGVYCMGYKFSDEPGVRMWVPGAADFPRDVRAHILAGGVINAWNAAFERLIFWYVVCPDYDVPEPALCQFHCTAARAQAHGMPKKLAEALRYLDLPVAKNPEGMRLIREYSSENVPWAKIPPQDQALWLTYCDSDVVAEEMVGLCLRQLTDQEWYEYEINELCNDRGVPVDLEMAHAALSYAEAVRAEVDGKLQQLTEGKMVNSRQRKARDQWVLEQLDEDCLRAIRKPRLKDAPEDAPPRYSFDEDHRAALRLEPTCPALVVEYLDLMDEAGGATISKYGAMVNREVDGAVQGSFAFNGAGQTGRFSSLGVQWQNLNRDSLEDPEAAINLLVRGYTLPDVTKTLSRLVRAAIYRPEGLSWFDYSGIESIMAPYLAGSREGEEKLQLFRKGIDPYKVNASAYYNVPYDSVTKDQRQAGKVQELALGFLGGKGALQVMGRNYGLHLTDDVAQSMVFSWRARNPWCQHFGNDLDRAACLALKNPGMEYEAGRITYVYDGGDWLWCQLPSGRFIAYGKPCLELVPTPWGDERLAVTCLWGSAKPKRGQPWPRRAMHPGIWIENVTQGASACLLRGGLRRVHEAGLDCRLHVHDEIVVNGRHNELLGRIMLNVEAWAQAAPLKGAGGCGTRYGK